MKTSWIEETSDRKEGYRDGGRGIEVTQSRMCRVRLHNYNKALSNGSLVFPARPACQPTTTSARVQARRKENFPITSSDIELQTMYVLRNLKKLQQPVPRSTTSSRRSSLFADLNDLPRLRHGVETLFPRCRRRAPRSAVRGLAGEGTVEVVHWLCRPWPHHRTSGAPRPLANYNKALTLDVIVAAGQLASDFRGRVRPRRAKRSVFLLTAPISSCRTLHAGILKT